jgi:ribonuclease D
MWEPPEPADEASIAEALRAHGARPWQVDLTAGVVAAALEPATEPAEPSPEAPTV